MVILGTLIDETAERRKDDTLPIDEIHAGDTVDLGETAPFDAVRPEASRPRGPVLGIDLGTTNSSAAILSLDTKRPEAVYLEDDLIRTRLPSVVWFDQANDRMVVGVQARRAATRYPHAVRAEFKRDMPYASATFWTLGEGASARQETPETLSAIMLAEIRRRAEASLAGEGEAPVVLDRAVITVPAAFPETASAATLAAATAAGFTDVKLLDEPTAAALAYALDKGEEISRIVVFDFGGGTLDCSILTVPGEGDKPFRVSDPVGDDQLGGKDFDEAVVRLLADRVIAASRRPPEQGPFDVLSDDDLGISTNKRARWRATLKEQAEALKHQLTDLEEASFTISSDELVDYDGKPLEVSGTITRDAFNAATAPLVERAMQILRRTLGEAGLVPGDVDRLVLVGGTTKIPAVEQAIATEFGFKPYGDVDRLTAVAQGAAIFGFIDDVPVGETSMDSAGAIDVLASHNLGVLVGLTRLDTLIRKNDTLPTPPVTRTYQPMREDAAQVVIRVRQYDETVAARGDGDDMPDVHDDDFTSSPQRVFELGTVAVEVLPGPQREIDVTFTMNRNRALEVVVRRQSDGVEFPLSIQRPR
jgi:molecular chaperone DnaK